MSIEYPYKDHEERAEILPVPDEQEFPVKQLSVYCSCVKTARKYGDYIVPRIDSPADLEPNTMPHVGSFVLIDYIGDNGEKIPHMAIVGGFTADTLVLGDEGNYSACEHTRGREIAIDDPRIRGYWAGEKKPSHLANR